MTTNWGLLSTARINDYIISAANKSDRVRITAVASRDAARAEAYARDNEIARSYGSYEELLSDPDIDAVYIPLPNSMHVDWTVRALEAGKHVLCEKPLSRHAADVERAFSVAERTGRLLMEAFMYRHNPQTSRLKELVQSGAVGTPQLVRAAFSFNLTRPNDIRMSAELEGGSLMDVGCYCVSGTRNLFGEPETVYGEQITAPTGLDKVFTGTMRMPGDILASFDSALTLSTRDELEVIGDEASLFVDDPWHCRSPVIELRADDKVEEINLDAVDSYQLQLENFSDAIKGGAPPLLGRDDAMGQAQTIEGLYRSAAERTPVALTNG
jgi:D-xylose 1-dehydrogenase (NADP+, D-xylono-1,5-lactone-forming)